MQSVEPQKPRPSGKGRRAPVVLVVEDDRDVRESIAELLVEAGWVAFTAEDGEDALEQLLEWTNPPNLVILDLKMPKRSGWEVLEVLRSSTTLVNVPIVVLSAFMAFPPAGAVAWLRKPLKKDELLQTVERVSRR